MSDTNEENYKKSPEYLALPKSRQYLVDIMVETFRHPFPWTKGWQTLSPAVSIRGREYLGENSVALMLTTMKRGYKDPRWVTFNQIKTNGWTFKNNEKGEGLGKGAGVNVSFFELRDKITKQPFESSTVSGLSREEKEEYMRQNVYPVRKTYTVFNADIISGIPELENKSMEDRATDDNYPEAKKFLDFWDKNVCGIRYGGSAAAYDVARDRIRLPEKKDFVSEEEFYCTAFHELSHSTQHLLRPGKRLSTDMSSREYAKDEVEAEICSIFLSQKFCGGVNLDEMRNSSSYINMWLSRSDRYGELFSAMAEAEHMYKFACDKFSESDKTAKTEKSFSDIETAEDTMNEASKPADISAPPPDNNSGDETRVKDDHPRLESHFDALEGTDANLQSVPETMVGHVSDEGCDPENPLAFRAGPDGYIPPKVYKARMALLDDSDRKILEDEFKNDAKVKSLHFGGDPYDSKTRAAATLLTYCAFMGGDEDTAKRLFRGSAYSDVIDEKFIEALTKDALGFTTSFRDSMLKARKDTDVSKKEDYGDMRDM